MVPDKTNAVAIEKSFEQLVLDIHPLYTPHQIYGDVIHKDWVSAWAREENWSGYGNGGLGLSRKKTYFLFVPVNRKWVRRASMRGEETIIELEEVSRELLRPDFGQI